VFVDDVQVSQAYQKSILRKRQLLPYR